MYRLDWGTGGGGRLLFFAHAKNVCDEFPSHVALHTLCRQAGQKFCKILLWGTTRCKHYKWVCIPYMVLHTCIRMIGGKISMSFVAKVINDWMHFLIRIRELLVNSDPDPTRPIKLSIKNLFFIQKLYNPQIIF